MVLQKARILREGGWVAAGQLLTAIAALVSIRIMTELLSPEEFGRLTLMVGVAALALGLASTPRLQAVIRYYPDWSNRGKLEVLRQVASSLITSLVAVAAILIVSGWSVASFITSTSWFAGVMVAALLVVDAVRGFEHALLNAARRQQVTARIQIADAWARPLLAIPLVAWLGSTAEAALLGYVIGAGLVVLGMRYLVRLEGYVGRTHAARPEDERITTDLATRIRKYAWPLAPLAIFGWFSGMGDRYVIGGMLGLAEAGLYAATYALASRPFLMLSGIIEQTLRPVLQNAIATNDNNQVGRVKRTMLLTMAGGAGFGVLCFVLLKDVVASLLLAEQYRAAAELMPWIALGYAFLTVSNVYSRFCYAFDATDYVLVLTVAGGVIGIVVLIPAIIVYGLAGAAAAVPVRFGVELLLSYTLSRKAEHRFMGRSREGDHAVH